MVSVGGDVSVCVLVCVCLKIEVVVEDIDFHDVLDHRKDECQHDLEGDVERQPDDDKPHQNDGSLEDHAEDWQNNHNC